MDRMISSEKLIHDLSGIRDTLPDIFLKNVMSAAISCVEKQPSADAVEIKTIEAWLYEIALNNVGEKFDGGFSDSVEEIINRLDGLRVFASERRTDCFNET